MSSDNHTPQLIKKNSWYLKTGYIHNFICKCGQVDQYGSVISTQNHPDHRCSHCGNMHYLDSVMLLHNKKVLYWSQFYWEYETVKQNNMWTVSATMKIPQFDYVLQKIRFTKITLSSMYLTFSGIYRYTEMAPIILQKYMANETTKAPLLKNVIYKELRGKLRDFVLFSPHEKISWVTQEQIEKYSTGKQITVLSFFLEHPHLKEMDFFHWKDFVFLQELSMQYPNIEAMLGIILNHRMQKSIKKACFESYARSMQELQTYHYMADYIFSRHIEDRNFLLELIRIDPKIKVKLFEESSKDAVQAFMLFLKQYYSEKTITKCFTSLQSHMFDHYNIVRDTIRMFESDRDFTLEHFQKVPLTFRNLHNEFIRLSNLRNKALKGKVDFDYHPKDLRAQTRREGLSYVLPETIYVLREWSKQLHNCMYGYSKAIHEKRSIIYGVFKEDVLLYAVELRGKRIVQALGKYNVHIEKDERVKIDEWHKEVYVDSWMRGDV